MTGASVNFKPVQSASQAVQHADRTVKPKYLLSEKVSLGTICVLDDKGTVAQTLDAKMALASRQARAAKNFSPVWEGVLNLPRPALNSKNFDVAEYKKHCIEITNSWIDEYQKATDHKVLRADIHLDEGHIDEVTGEVLLNAHAHIISDKTNERGKVFIIDRKEMRKLQTMTAEVTGLARGKSSIETGRKHMNPTAYKAVAKAHGLEIKKEKGTTARIQKLFDGDTKKIDDLKAQIAKIEADYKAEREAAKASGTAKQADYQRMKKERDDAVAELKTTKEKMVGMDEYTKKLEADLAAGEDKIAQALIEKAAAIEALVQAGVKSEAVLVTAEGHRDAAAKLTSQSIHHADLTPDQVIGPNERARLRALEATKTASEAPKLPEVPIPSPHPEKQPVDLFKRLQESWDRMIEWITGNSGKRVEVNTQSSEHFGPVVQLDDLHAVQRTGRDLFAVHQLDDLDKVPALDDPLMVIRYHDGKGVVHGQLGKPGVQR